MDRDMQVVNKDIYQTYKFLGIYVFTILRFCNLCAKS